LTADLLAGSAQCTANAVPEAPTLHGVPDPTQITSRTDDAPRLRRVLLGYPVTTTVLFGIVASFPLFLAGAYAVRLQEHLGATKAQFGWAAAAYFAAGTLGSLQLGRLVDRHGSRFGGVVAAIGGFVASLFIGLATQRWWMLAIGLGITGFANTAGQLAGNRILAASVRTERQGIGFGAKQSSVPFGSFLAGIVVSLLGVDVSWRATFVVYGVAALAIAVVSPEFGAAPRSEITGRKGVGRDRTALVVLGLAGAFIGATGNALAVLVVDAFETAGFNASVAAGTLAFGGAAAVIGRVLIGWLVDRRGSDGYAELTAIVIAGVAGFASLAVAGRSVPLLVLGVGFGFAAGWGWPAIIYLVTVRNSTAPPGTSTGFVLTGVFFGAIVGPPLFATIAEQVSYPTAWATAAVMTALGAIGVQISRSLSVVRRSAEARTR